MRDSPLRQSENDGSAAVRGRTVTVGRRASTEVWNRAPKNALFRIVGCRRKVINEEDDGSEIKFSVRHGRVCGGGGFVLVQ